MILCVSDIETGISKDDEVSNVTVSAGQPLLLRCRNKDSSQPGKWEKGSKMMNASTLALPSSDESEVMRVVLRVSLKFHMSKFELFLDTILS